MLHVRICAGAARKSGPYRDSVFMNSLVYRVNSRCTRAGALSLVTRQLRVGRCYVSALLAFSSME